MNDQREMIEFSEDVPSRALPRISPRAPCSVLFIIACAVLLGSSFVAEAGWLKPDVDFTSYDTPLYEQITNRIKAKVLARLGDGQNTHDRYFIIPFAYQDEGNAPGFSHSFMSVIRVLADNKQPKLTS